MCHLPFSAGDTGKNLPVEHCIEGTDGWQISTALEVKDSKAFNKPAFGSIEVADYIFSLNTSNTVESIEIVGLCTDICVISNALLLKAKLPETPISVDSNCCAGVTPESHKNVLNAMKMCQIEIS